MKKQIFNTAFLLLIINLSFAQYYPVGGYQGGAFGNDLPVQTIELTQGWNGVSSYLDPANPEVDQVLSSIEDELIIFYNLNGMFWPGQGINTFNYWNTHTAYATKVTEDVELEIRGTTLDYQQVYLEQGWRMMPVLSEDPVAVADLFAGVDDLEIVKSIAGNGVYWPQYNINQLGNLEPGLGYCVKMNDGGSIDFASTKGATEKLLALPETFINSPWNEVVSTNASHTIAFVNHCLDVCEEGDIVGAFNASGTCTGVIRISGNKQNLALNVFADDPFTGSLDGLNEAEMIDFRLFRESTAEIFILKPRYEMTYDRGNFASNGLSVVVDLELQLSIDENWGQEKIRILPNPTSDMITIKGIDSETEVLLYNSYGNLLRSGFYYSNIIWDMNDLPKGIYFIKIKTFDCIYLEKLVIN